MYVRPRIRKTQLKNVLWCCWIYAPMSAFFKAGESLTPSPVTATMAPCRWQPSTMISFCCGEVLANTISVWFFRISSSCSLEISWEDITDITTHLTITIWNVMLIYWEKNDKRDIASLMLSSLGMFLKSLYINFVLKFSLLYKLN